MDNHMTSKCGVCGKVCRVYESYVDTMYICPDCGVTEENSVLKMSGKMKSIDMADRINNDEVICPKCCHQFRGIPVNVQTHIDFLEHDLSSLRANCFTIAEMKKVLDDAINMMMWGKKQFWEKTRKGEI